MLSKDGEKLFYLTNFEKGNDLWVTEIRTRETKLFNKLGANNASMELSPDGKFLFVIADGKAVKVDTESGKSEPIGVNTEMVLDYSAEKAYIFDHSWRQFKQKLIFPDLSSVDWDSYYTIYKKIPAVHQQQLRLRRDAERDARRDERLSHRCLLQPERSRTGRRRRRSVLLYDYAYTGDGVKSRRGDPGRSGRSGGLDDQGRPHHRSRSTAPTIDAVDGFL